MDADEIRADLLPTKKEQVPESLVLQVIRVADLLTRVGDARVFGEKLTQPQFNVLMILKRHGREGMSQKDIADYLVWTKGNVSIHVTNLVRMGYVRRKSSRSDARANVITLTARGRRVLADLEPRYMEQIERLSENLPSQQARTAIEVLSKLGGKCEVMLGAEGQSAQGKEA
ncbi:MAG: MarR family winged helix-turn-helix transcriptional regulator [Verrucomicrobiota bacterium]